MSVPEHHGASLAIAARRRRIIWWTMWLGIWAVSTVLLDLILVELFVPPFLGRKDELGSVVTFVFGFFFIGAPLATPLILAGMWRLRAHRALKAFLILFVIGAIAFLDVFLYLLWFMLHMAP
jgi:hypothetical protein